MSAKTANLFSRQDFFDKVFRKSGSYNSLNGAKSSMSNLDQFCDSIYHKITDDLLTEIWESIQENPNDVTPMILLDKFSSYLQDKKKVLAVSKITSISQRNT